MAFFIAKNAKNANSPGGCGRESAQTRFGAGGAVVMLQRPPKPPPAKRGRRRELARARHRKHRQRVRAHRFTVTIELGESELTWLVACHWISPQEADTGDRTAIGTGVTNGIAASARG